MSKYVDTHVHLLVISFSLGVFNDETLTVFLFQKFYVTEDLITRSSRKRRGQSQIWLVKSWKSIAPLFRVHE